MTVYESNGTRSFGWFRIFGWGLWWKDTARHRLLFSEREGRKQPSFTVGSYWFAFLKRGQPR